MKNTCLPLTPSHHRDQVYEVSLQPVWNYESQFQANCMTPVYFLQNTKNKNKQKTEQDSQEWFGIPGVFKKATQVSLITCVTPLSYTIPHIYNRHKAVQLICQQNETDRVKIMSCVITTFRKTEIRHNHFVK